MRKKEGESKCKNCLPCGNVTKLVGHHPCIAFSMQQAAFALARMFFSPQLSQSEKRDCS